MPTCTQDDSLLFAVLIRHLDLLPVDALVAPLRDWQAHPSQPLRGLLVSRGLLTEEVCALIDGLVQEHRTRHVDLVRSLMAFPCFAELRQFLDLPGAADLSSDDTLVQRFPGKAIPTGAALDSVRGSSTLVKRLSGSPPPLEVPRPEIPRAGMDASTAAARAAAPIRFRTLRLLGRGALGEVFVAQDEELQREVALKEIQTRHLEDPESRERFLLEAEITGHLEHPGIVPVYGLGLHEDGRPFYAMRFIKGESLQEALTRFHGQRDRPEHESTLELRQLLGRFVALCNAIAYAHSRGVLHRDIKPDNVMLGEFGETLVVDWGLAKRLGTKDIESSGGTASATATDSGFTQLGQTLGTPAYMSPEQAAGRHTSLGPASDVYSLGATLFALLTGQPPFTGPSAGVVLELVQVGNLPSARAIQPSVPAALEAVVHKAMALHPEQRYPTASDLAVEVERWLAGEPPRAYREPWRQRLGRWVRRRQTTVAAVLVLLLTAAVGSSLGTLLISREQALTAQALRDQQEARRQEEEARSGRALAQVEQLCTADAGAVPTILEHLAPFRAEVLPRLREQWADQGEPRQRRMRAGLALLPSDPDGVQETLFQWMLETDDPRELKLTRDVLKPYAATLPERLWAVAGDKGAKAPVRFRALVALALFDPDNPRWDGAAPAALEPWLRADPLFLGVLTRALAPARMHLIAPLVEVAKGRNSALPDKRYEAASVLAIYAADRAETLVDLLLESDERQFALLFPRVQARGPEALALLRRALEQPLVWSWSDAPARWPEPDERVRREIERADGLVGERFALCQTLPEGRGRAVVEGLRGAGYRPLNYRPYATAQGVRVAVVWTRDGAAWRLEEGGALDLEARGAELSRQGFQPVDVAGWLPTATEPRYAVLWGPKDAGTVESRLFVGSADSRNGWSHSREGFMPHTQFTLEVGGATLWTGIWRKPSLPTRIRFFGARCTAGDYGLAVAAPGRLQGDVRLSPLALPRTGGRRLPSPLSMAEQDEGLAEGERRLREARLEFAPDAGSPFFEAACAYARAAEGAEGWTVPLAVLAAGNRVAGPLGNGALTVQALEQQRRREAHTRRAVELLRLAIQKGLDKPERLRTDVNLSALRALPEVRALLRQAHQDRVYSTVFTESPTLVSVESHGLDPAAHLARIRQLTSANYRPVALSVAEVDPDGPLATASVWHRPLVPTSERDALPVRQANAALALLRLGQEEAVWPLLKHSPDPTRRTWMTLRMASRGVEARLLVDRLERTPEVSERRALLSALGEYDGERLPADLRARLVPRLLAWYRDDPDPGIHAGVDWLLRQKRDGPLPRALDWGQAEALTAIDAERRGKPTEGRRWSVNGQGMTFVHFPGPVEFVMGSLPTEPEHYFDEIPHRRRIERGFALSSRKVTMRDYRAFLEAHPEVFRDPLAGRYSPEPDCPVGSVTWYEAAQFCRWLSEEEGIPEEEMCYPSISELEIYKKDPAKALKLPPDQLSRKGYRLPTEAEWEYACRAGAATARYYGACADDLLGVHAWYIRNAQERTWPVGQKRPNDFGLFDMLGNTWDWCQGPAWAYPNGPKGYTPDEEDKRDVVEGLARAMRGGSFLIQASGLRSPCRFNGRPNLRTVTNGLRVARTL